MGLKIGDLADYLDPGLDVTVRGKAYHIPEPSAEVGLWLQATGMVAAPELLAGRPLDEATVARVMALPMPESMRGLSLPQAILGPAYDELVADGVPLSGITHLTHTMIALITGGEAGAKAVFASGVRPEAPSPANRATRRAAAKTTPTRSASPTTSTAVAPTTPTPASGSGTTSQKSASKAARPSRGRKS